MVTTCPGNGYPPGWLPTLHHSSIGNEFNALLPQRLVPALTSCITTITTFLGRDERGGGGGGGNVYLDLDGRLPPPSVQLSTVPRRDEHVDLGQPVVLQDELLHFTDSCRHKGTLGTQGWRNLLTGKTRAGYGDYVMLPAVSSPAKSGSMANLITNNGRESQHSFAQELTVQAMEGLVGASNLI